MSTKKSYTKTEVDDYVRKLMTDSEIALTHKAEQLDKERKEKEKLLAELEEYKKKEKSISRMLVIAERKARYLETTTRSRCAIEIERLARLADKWDEFFAGLSEKYEAVDKEKLSEFKKEISATIDNMLEMEDGFNDAPLSEAEKSHLDEINRLKVVKEKKNSDLSDRFDRLVLEFNMKIGDNATRGRGRPKKGETVSVKGISEKQNKASKQRQKPVYPAKGDSDFDFEEALNPVDSLEDIMKDLIGDDE
ncbi:MAG: hypothetical protein IJS74_00630 [Clostridia bacterium]|nr:hypothetical protein [Clostridia bacterium]